VLLRPKVCGVHRVVNVLEDRETLPRADIPGELLLRDHDVDP
jgi:hypothetical protein